MRPRSSSTGAMSPSPAVADSSRAGQSRPMARDRASADPPGPGGGALAAAARAASSRTAAAASATGSGSAAPRARRSHSGSETRPLSRYAWACTRAGSPSRRASTGSRGETPSRASAAPVTRRARAAPAMPSTVDPGGADGAPPSASRVRATAPATPRGGRSSLRCGARTRRGRSPARGGRPAHRGRGRAGRGRGRRCRRSPPAGAGVGRGAVEVDPGGPRDQIRGDGAPSARAASARRWAASESRPARYELTARRRAACSSRRRAASGSAARSPSTSRSATRSPPPPTRGSRTEALDVGHLRRARPPQMPFGGEGVSGGRAPGRRRRRTPGPPRPRPRTGRRASRRPPPRVVQVPAGVGAVPMRSGSGRANRHSRSTDRPRRDDLLELEVHDLAFGGGGVAGTTATSSSAATAPPATACARRVVKARRRFAEADLVEVLRPGPGRVEAPCPYVPAVRRVPSAARRVRPCPGGQARPGGRAPRPHRAPRGRGRARARRGHRALPLPQQDGVSARPGAAAVPAIGFHVRGRWDEIVDVGRLPAGEPARQRGARERSAWAAAEGVPPYDQRAHTGVLRHVLVREGVATGQVLVSVVTSPGAEEAVTAWPSPVGGPPRGRRAGPLGERRRGRGDLRTGGRVSTVATGSRSGSPASPSACPRRRSSRRTRMTEHALRASRRRRASKGPGCSTTCSPAPAASASRSPRRRRRSWRSRWSRRPSPTPGATPRQRRRRTTSRSAATSVRCCASARGSCRRRTSRSSTRPAAASPDAAIRRILELAPPILRLRVCPLATSPTTPAKFVEGATAESVRRSTCSGDAPHRGRGRFTRVHHGESPSRPRRLAAADGHPRGLVHMTLHTLRPSSTIV